MSKAIPFLFLIFLLSSGSSYGQVANGLTFEQLDSLQQIEKRPVLVFIHTSWCRYCQAMEHTTFQDEEVNELLNKDFYFVTLDAEEKRDITLKGHTFSYQPTGSGSGQHELAQILGQVNGKLAFPTLCFLNSNNEIIYQSNGFLTAKQLVETIKLISRNTKTNQ